MAIERVVFRYGGEKVTLDNRAASYEAVDKAERYRQIIECLEECPKMTAKQIAVRMWEKGYIPTGERNFSAPRLTELAKKGVVDTVGKMRCQWTGKMVTLYELRTKEM